MNRFNILAMKPISLKGLNNLVEKRALLGKSLQNVTEDDLKVLLKTPEPKDK